MASKLLFVVKVALAAIGAHELLTLHFILLVLLCIVGTAAVYKPPCYRRIPLFIRSSLLISP